MVFKLTHPASYFVDMLTLPAFSPAPRSATQVPAGQPGAGAAPDLRRPLQDRLLEADQEHHVQSATLRGTPSTDPIRKAYVDKVVINETVSQDSIQQQLQTGTPTAPTWSSTTFPPPSQLPALIAKKDPNLNLGDDARRPTPTSSSTRSRRTTTRRCRTSRCGRRSPTRSTATNMIQVLGGPKRRPAADPRPAAGIVGGERLRPVPVRPGQGQADARRRRLPQRPDAEDACTATRPRAAARPSRPCSRTCPRSASRSSASVPERGLLHEVPRRCRPSAKRGVWDIAIAGWGADWYGNAALSFFAPLFSGEPSFPPIGSNFGFYNNPTTNDLIEQAAIAKTEDEAGGPVGPGRPAGDGGRRRSSRSPTRSQANYHAAQVHNAVYIPAFQNFDPANVWLEPRASRAAERDPGAATMALLEVVTSRVSFNTPDGVVQAVRGLSFESTRADPRHRRRVRLGQERRDPDHHRADPRRPGQRDGPVRRHRPAHGVRPRCCAGSAARRSA